MGRGPSGSGPGQRGGRLSRSPFARRIGQALLAATILAAFPAAAQEADDKLEAVERELGDTRAAQSALEQDAARLREEIGALRVRMVLSAQSLQDREEVMTGLEGQLARLDQVRAEKMSALRARHGQLVETIAALQRIALNPPEAFLVRSDEEFGLAAGDGRFGERYLQSLRQDQTDFFAEGRQRADVGPVYPDSDRRLDRRSLFEW